MKKLTQLATLSAAPALIILTFRHAVAQPYLDAGTGSIIIQALIGSAVGGLLALKIFWHRIKTFFNTLFNRGKTSDDARE